MIVGRVIHASNTEPVSAVSPVGARSATRTSGASMTMPMKPITTDGMPASTSTKGLSTSRTQDGATSPMKTAVARPSGRASTAAPNVTSTEPRINGSRPKCPSMGYQRVANRLDRSTSTKAGKPSRSRNRKINTTSTIADTPVALIRRSMR